MRWDEFKKAKIKGLDDAKRKCEVDERIIPLLDLINSQKGFVTTSSCSGRIALLEIDKNKSDSRFFHRWHERISVEQMLLKLLERDGKRRLWFRCEPFILHISCKDLIYAKKILDIMKEVGIKRGGIQTIADEKVNIEIQGHGQLLVPYDAVDDWDLIVEEANKMMDKNWEKIKRMQEAFSKN